MKSDKNVRKQFNDLLGFERVDYIVDSNWVKFTRKPHEIYNTNEIEISFLEKDGCGDTVCFLSINYNEDRKSWRSENGVEYPYIEFASFDEMMSHLDTLSDDITDNGFPLADLDE